MEKTECPSFFFEYFPSESFHRQDWCFPFVKDRSFTISNIFIRNGEPRRAFQTEDVCLEKKGDSRIKDDLESAQKVFDEMLLKGYLPSFEIMYDTILEAMLKLDENIKEATKKFPANPKINDWMPRFNDFLGITSEADEEDRDVSPTQGDEANQDVA
ncbi:hypothetical protein LXL04_006481 [Taraxacum kok-saghyz]